LGLHKNNLLDVTLGYLTQFKDQVLETKLKCLVIRNLLSYFKFEVAEVVMVVKVVAELLIFMAVIKFEVIFKELLMLMLI